MPYDPSWPKLFEVEAEIIKKALGDNLVAIYHVGSTSVPGLVAKPKIDILVVVKDCAGIIEQLEHVSIQYKGEYNIPLHYGFSKRNGVIDVNVHVYQEGHPEIELNLLFRDYLRMYPVMRDTYASLKKTILLDTTAQEKSNCSFANYTLRKGTFIREVLKQAGFNRLRMLKASDETEWLAVKNFRNIYFFEPLGIDDPYTWTFNHPQHEHLILYQGVDIIGYAHIQLWLDKRAAIRIIMIDEALRNNTIGSTFLDLCHTWLKGQTYISIHAESSPTALAFYKKNGYIEMPFNDPDGYECGAEDVAVGKKL